MEAMFNFSFGDSWRGLAAARTKPEGRRRPEPRAEDV